MAETTTTTPEPEDPRIRLAAERTVLAWIRTGLALMGFGFVVARFSLFLRELAATRPIPAPTSTGISHWLGMALVAIGVLVNVVAGVQHARFLSRLKRGQPYVPPRWSLAVVVTVVMALVGVGLTAYLIHLGP